jgi:HAD superfamily hydrolase (TIGR01509 family)
MKMKKFKLKAAIFDLDGTLLDSMMVWRSLTEAYLKGKGIEPEKDLSFKLLGKSSEFQSNYVYEKYGIKTTPDQVYQETIPYIKNYYAEIAEPKPGILEFLDLLKSKNIPCAIATATPLQLMESALDKFGFKKYFKVVITTYDIGVGKHKPDIYETAVNRLNADKATTVIFEDALYAVKTLKKHNFNCCVIADKITEPDPEPIKTISDMYIENWFEAPDLFEF